MIQKHNQDVDQFTQEMSPDQLLEQMAKFEDLKNGGNLDRDPKDED